MKKMIEILKERLVSLKMIRKSSINTGHSKVSEQARIAIHNIDYALKLAKEEQEKIYKTIEFLTDFINHDYDSYFREDAIKLLKELQEQL